VCVLFTVTFITTADQQSRRRVLRSRVMRSVAPIVLLMSLLVPQEQAPASFELEEAIIEQLQEWMQSGRYTALRLAELHLVPIVSGERVDVPRLRET